MDERNEKTEKLLTVFEVAERYGGIHYKTVERYWKAKRIPAPIPEKFGKGRVWLESVIEKHLQSLRPKE